MPLIVADTSPIFYLLSINHIDLLPQVVRKGVTARCRPPGK